MTIDEHLGESIHTLMWRRRITNVHLSQQLGIGKSALGRKLRGERKWTLEEAVTVARLLEVDLSDLLPSPRDEWAPRGSNPQPTGYRVRHLRAVAA